jgi:hypothetical protein
MTFQIALMLLGLQGFVLGPDFTEKASVRIPDSRLTRAIATWRIAEDGRKAIVLAPEPFLVNLSTWESKRLYLEPDNVDNWKVAPKSVRLTDRWTISESETSRPPLVADFGRFDGTSALLNVSAGRGSFSGIANASVNVWAPLRSVSGISTDSKAITSVDGRSTAVFRRGGTGSPQVIQVTGQISKLFKLTKLPFEELEAFDSRSGWIIGLLADDDLGGGLGLAFINLFDAKPHTKVIKTPNKFGIPERVVLLRDRASLLVHLNRFLPSKGVRSSWLLDENHPSEVWLYNLKARKWKWLRYGRLLGSSSGGTWVVVSEANAIRAGSPTINRTWLVKL